MIDDYYKKAIEPFRETLYYEMSNNFGKAYVVDTYKQLLHINSFVGCDLSDLEVDLIDYCLKDEDRVVNLTKGDKDE